MPAVNFRLKDGSILRFPNEEQYDIWKLQNGIQDQNVNFDYTKAINDGLFVQSGTQDGVPIYDYNVTLPEVEVYPNTAPKYDPETGQMYWGPITPGQRVAQEYQKQQEQQRKQQQQQQNQPMPQLHLTQEIPNKDNNWGMTIKVPSWLAKAGKNTWEGLTFNWDSDGDGIGDRIENSRLPGYKEYWKPGFDGLAYGISLFAAPPVFKAPAWASKAVAPATRFIGNVASKVSQPLQRYVTPHIDNAVTWFSTHTPNLTQAANTAGNVAGKTLNAASNLYDRAFAASILHTLGTQDAYAGGNVPSDSTAVSGGMIVPQGGQEPDGKLKRLADLVSTGLILRWPIAKGANAYNNSQKMKRAVELSKQYDNAKDATKYIKKIEKEIDANKLRLVTNPWGTVKGATNNVLGIGTIGGSGYLGWQALDWYNPGGYDADDTEATDYLNRSRIQVNQGSPVLSDSLVVGDSAISLTNGAIPVNGTIPVVDDSTMTAGQASEWD